jgi:hypothetical protein
VPIIDGKYQQVGREASSSSVEYRKGYFSMDIAGAYPDGVAKSVVRSFEMDDKTVTLTDKFDVKTGSSIVERFVSLVEPSVVSDGVIAFGECRFSYFGDADMKLSTEETHNGTCYIVDFVLKDGANEFKVVME